MEPHRPIHNPGQSNPEKIGNALDMAATITEAVDKSGKTGKMSWWLRLSAAVAGAFKR